MNPNDIIYRLRKRAEIRRTISTRKSVQEGKPDRIADLLYSPLQSGRLDAPVAATAVDRSEVRL